MTEPPQFYAAPWPANRDLAISYLCHHQPLTVYGMGEFDVTDAWTTIRQYQRRLRIAISFHAFVLYCLAQAVNKNLAMQTYRHKRKLITFTDVDISTTVDKRGHIPLGFTVRSAQHKSLAAINWELRQALRGDPTNQEVVRRRRAVMRLPKLIRQWIFSRIFKNPFLLNQYYGTVGLTSLQTQGLQQPFLGLPPNIFTLTIAVGTLVDRMIVDSDGKPVLRKILYLTGGADHAVIDGMQMARFVKDLAELLEHAAGLDESFLEETRDLVNCHDNS